MFNLLYDDGGDDDYDDPLALWTLWFYLFKHTTNTNKINFLETIDNFNPK